MVVGKLPFSLQNDDVDRLCEEISGLHYPDFLSPMLVHLLQGVLNPDPEKRLTMYQVQTHVWVWDQHSDIMKYSFTKPNIEKVKSVDGISNLKRKALFTPNKHILTTLSQSGLESKKVNQDLRRGTVSSMTAAYFISLKNIAQTSDNPNS
jgi:serine/threonine protein kinase